MATSNELPFEQMIEYMATATLTELESLELHLLDEASELQNMLKRSLETAGLDEPLQRKLMADIAELRRVETVAYMARGLREMRGPKALSERVSAPKELLADVIAIATESEQQPQRLLGALPTDQALPDQGQSMRDALIQERVAEAMASEGAILEPWFQSPAVAAAIRREQSIFHKRKHSLYFEKWGCLVCGTEERAHVSHAMCHNCLLRFVNRLKQLEREYAKAHPQEYEDRQIEKLAARIRSAERILGAARPMDSEEK